MISAILSGEPGVKSLKWSHGDGVKIIHHASAVHSRQSAVRIPPMIAQALLER